LYAISEAGLTATASKTTDILKVYPVEKISPELATAIKAHKAAIIRVIREDEELRHWCHSVGAPGLQDGPRLFRSRQVA